MKTNIIVFLSLLILSACGTTSTTNQTESKSQAEKETQTVSIVQLASDVNSSIVYINENKWSYKKITKADDPSEYSFEFNEQSKGFVSGKLITEKLTIDVQTLTKAAYINAAQSDPDVQIIKKEERTINGNDVIYMEMAGAVDGIKFTYYGVYHSNKYGVTQLVTYLLSDTAEIFHGEIQDFLSGFDVAKK